MPYYCNTIYYGHISEVVRGGKSEFNFNYFIHHVIHVHVVYICVTYTNDCYCNLFLTNLRNVWTKKYALILLHRYYILGICLSGIVC